VEGSYDKLKVAINNGGNGFGLSTEAIRYIAKLKNSNVYCYHKTGIKSSNGKNEYTKIDDNYGDDGFVYYMTEDAGDITNELKGELFTPFVSRDDVFLIKTIEDIGNKASASYSKLQVIEIPNNSKFTIIKNIDNNWHCIETVDYKLI